MKRNLILSAFVVFVALGASASWYWPFGSDEPEENARRPRLSEMMEPASQLIDEATDLAEDGKSTEAVEKYRAALKELDKIERENSELADKPEYATLRNKRAYVNATIDSLLLEQVKSNARAVAVSDTTELEKKLAAEKAAKNVDKVAKALRRQAMADLAAGDVAAALLSIDELLAAKPDDAAGLNLLAAAKTSEGDYKAAERALDRAISSNPRSHHAYYNMAKLILKSQPTNKKGAKRYYEAGREVGGPEDAKLEAQFE
jgi:tetratricopeptide (TPR) repeat protein